MRNTEHVCELVTVSTTKSLGGPSLILQTTPFTEEGSGHIAVDKLLLRNATVWLDNKMLTSAEHSVYSIITVQSTKGTDLIGHSKFLPWQQLDGCSVTRPFLSL